MQARSRLVDIHSSEPLKQGVVLLCKLPMGCLENGKWPQSLGERSESAIVSLKLEENMDPRSLDKVARGWDKHGCGVAAALARHKAPQAG